MLSWYVLISFWFEARQVAQPKFARGAPQAGTEPAQFAHKLSWEVAKKSMKDFTED